CTVRRQGLAIEAKTRFGQRALPVRPGVLAILRGKNGSARLTVDTHYARARIEPEIVVATHGAAGGFEGRALDGGLVFKLGGRVRICRPAAFLFQCLRVTLDLGYLLSRIDQLIAERCVAGDRGQRYVGPEALS